ncbi:MAG: hypothetical protein E7415_01145 [Ruminococcaceae bacterium]|nr:hypothetical protein [Oscillospiraceae bacterium]
MAGKLKKLRIYGILYFIFGFVDALNLLIRVWIGEYSVAQIVKSEFFNETVGTLVMVLEFFFTAIVVAAYLCLALKGYSYGIGEGYGYTHVKVAKIMPALLAIRLGITVLMIFGKQVDYISIVTDIVGLSTIFSYSRCARIALES